MSGGGRWRGNLGTPDIEGLHVKLHQWFSPETIPHRYFVTLGRGNGRIRGGGG